jgi:hypothetical protein
MKKLKHSKFKNTGFLFEILTRQITTEVLNNSEERAKKIVKEFFSTGKELSKELKLFHLLLNEKYNTDKNAEVFIDKVVEAHQKLNHQKLEREKYNLVKAIKESFDEKSLMSAQINNYKIVASIQKVFDANKMSVLEVKDAVDSKITLIEHISNQKDKKNTKADDLVEFYKKQEKDLRLLTYKILMERFNDKYSKLNTAQKNLLREYINNISNTSQFKEYYKSQIDKVLTILTERKKTIKDKITLIKLNETINALRNQKISNRIKDNQVSALILSYELIKELQDGKR